MISINPLILAAQVVTFLIAVAILWKFAWGPLLKMIEDRRHGIQRDFDLIKESRETVKKAREEFDLKVARLERKAEETLAEAVAAGEKMKDEIIKKAREEADSIRRKAQEQLSEERERLVRELRQEVFGLSVFIAEKLVRGSVGRDLQERVMNETLEAVNRLSSQVRGGEVK